MELKMKSEKSKKSQLSMMARLMSAHVLTVEVDWRERVNSISQEKWNAQPRTLCAHNRWLVLAVVSS